VDSFFFSVALVWVFLELYVWGLGEQAGQQRGGEVRYGGFPDESLRRET
jgi:hypothetical protein